MSIHPPPFAKPPIGVPKEDNRSQSSCQPSQRDTRVRMSRGQSCVYTSSTVPRAANRVTTGQKAGDRAVSIHPPPFAKAKSRARACVYTTSTFHQPGNSDQLGRRHRLADHESSHPTALAHTLKNLKSPIGQTTDEGCLVTNPGVHMCFTLIHRALSLSLDILYLHRGGNPVVVQTPVRKLPFLLQKFEPSHPKSRALRVKNPIFLPFDHSDP